MVKALIFLLPILILSVEAKTGPKSVQKDRNDPMRPDNVLEEYSLPEQREPSFIPRRIQKQDSREEVEKKADIYHTQERPQPNDDNNQ